ncbi:MAG: hypothetical protein NT034_03305 [Candidatus Magasanikbacteria bacterium]|nr:hypothetical protein [Candidatus Magasanikbacteria bacterium]
MALNLGPQKIQTFFSQPIESVVLALNELVSGKDRLELFTPNSKGMFEVASVLARQEKNFGQLSLLGKIDRSLVSLISVDLIKDFISNPSDKELLESLSSQIFLIAAATDNLPASLKEIKPYDDDEMGLVLEGRLSYYDDILFVFTLRQIITSATSSSHIFKLLNSLPAAPSEEEFEENKFYWLDALIGSLILQAAWAYFLDLSTNDRRFLLQNYLYHSMVVGVPVEDRFKNAYQDLEGQEYNLECDGVIKLLDYNLELIPHTAQAVSGAKVSEVIHEFLPLVFEEKIQTFAQEKFITDFYQNEKDTQFMQGWLRDLLHLVLSLHQHTL